MIRKTILHLATALLVLAPAALAQGVPPGPPPGHGQMGPGQMGPGKPHDPEDMAKMHARMCQDGYAGEVGRLAALEVSLQLTDKQKPAFDRWKQVKLNAAKARAATCAAMKKPEPVEPEAGKTPPAPDPVEGLKRDEARLKDRLAELKTEIPALEALSATLSDEQKHALMPRHGGPGKRGPGGPGMRGPDAPPPPPPGMDE